MKANLSYEEIKRVEEARQSEGGGGGGGGFGLGGWWSLFTLPSSMTVVSTFPPSAAFFNKNHKYSPLDLDEKSHQGKWHRNGIRFAEGIWSGDSIR